MKHFGWFDLLCGIHKKDNNHTNSLTCLRHQLSEMGTIAYIGLGANLGDCRASLHQALRELAILPTIKIVSVSSLYETAPVGVTDQPNFFNQAAAVETSLSPQTLLQALLHIENQMGRTRTLRWGPRVIDLDLLLYGDAQITLPVLTVPHPRLRERGFVMIPLAEIAPELALPGDGKTVAEIAESFSQNYCNQGNIRRLDFV